MRSDYIKDFWDKQAVNFKTDHKASWGDNFAITLEIENIGSYIKAGDRVLDVGCANGFSSFHQLDKKPTHIMGIDFSEPMIKFAIERKMNEKAENLDFKVGDIRHLEFNDESFDLTYTTRVLINLPNWEQQKQGISECLRVTRKGGKVILSEAFYEPLVLLNSIRSLKGLAPLEEHDFNRYLKKKKLEDFLDRNGLAYNINDFSSIYYLGSRFLRELVTNVNDFEGYSNPVNKHFFDLEMVFSGGGFGIQMIYEITK